MHIVGWSDAQTYSDRLTYWTNVYEFKMTAMKQSIEREPYISVLPARALCTSASQLIVSRP